MFSFWSSSAASDNHRSKQQLEDKASRKGQSSAHVAPARRKVKSQQTSVEVIGGGSSSTHATPSTSSKPYALPDIGPPRLPIEVISHTILMAAEELVQDSPNKETASIALLRLASVNYTAHSAIHTQIILPSVCLTGVRQVVAFARDLSQNAVGLRAMAGRIRSLRIRRPSPKVFTERSLYADVEETTRFERATLAPLRLILSFCTGLETLHLDMTPRALDLHQQGDYQRHGVFAVSRSLKELVTMLSLYGGDLNERLWDTYKEKTALTPQRWSHLTHLQLHGPRFRLSPMTALALGRLPALTHLALIMPWIIYANVDANSQREGEGEGNGQEFSIAQSTDAQGRQNVLQLLLNKLGHHLLSFILVTHDMSGYVGSVQKHGPWFRALQWRTGSTEAAVEDLKVRDDGESSEPSETSLCLVTAKASTAQEGTAEPHPNLISKWMFQRAQGGRHWDWNDAEVDAIGGVRLSISVEEWKVPLVGSAPPQIDNSISA